MSDLYDLALSTCGEITRCRTSGDVIGILTRTAARCGYDHFCLADLPPPKSELSDFIFDHWPAGWLEHYFYEEFFNIDPVLAGLRVRALPFHWEEVYDQSQSTASSKMMRHAALDYKMKSGFAVPIFTIHGTQAAVSFTSIYETPPTECDAFLHLVALYAHGRLEELHSRPLAKMPGSLTPRELECVKWAAHGQTNLDIAEILNISERTVRAHIIAAQQKLRANNRTQTVANALRQRLIQ